MRTRFKKITVQLKEVETDLHVGPLEVIEKICLDCYLEIFSVSSIHQMNGGYTKSVYYKKCNHMDWVKCRATRKNVQSLGKKGKLGRTSVQNNGV